MTDEGDGSMDLDERARRVAEEATDGTLATLLEGGHPYTSYVELMFDGEDSFWLLLSDLATHSDNIERDRRASLLVTGERPEDEQRLQTPRVSFVGRMEADERGGEKMEDAYLQRHPHAEQFVEFEDFRFYRFQVERARVVAGFGRVGWVDAIGG